jgi:sarcosine oxidase
MHSDNYDVIVIGVGSMGSATCYNLAARGYKVLGLEQFDIPHESGSHAGQSRIIRKAYFEHPDYVPLLNRAYQNWYQLEKQTGAQVYFPTGLVYFGRPGNSMIKGVRESAYQHDIKIEELNHHQAKLRFPSFIIPYDYEAIWEADAGFITPEKAITLYKELAEKNGAEIHTREAVMEWRKEKDGITVVTNQNTYHSKKLIITTGPWAGKMLPQLITTLKVTRQVIGWAAQKNPETFSLDNFPCWLLADNEEGAYYGFPILPADKFGGPGGLKLAYHYPGQLTEPDKVNREVSEKDKEQIEYALSKYLPGADNEELTCKTCLYTYSTDENFIIDHLPGYSGDVTIACGFSGHGFKFVSVVGEILSDLAMNGKTDLPISFLSLKRFQ